MVEKKTVYALFIVLFVFTIIVVAYIILFYPQGKLEDHAPSKYATFEDFKINKLKEAFLKILTGDERDITVEIDRDELNELVGFIFRDELNQNTLNIKGYDAQIKKDGFIILFDSYILNFLPIRYMFEIKPLIENNNLCLYISKSKVGKITISPKGVLKRIEHAEKPYWYFDPEKSSIIIKNSYNEQIIFRNISIDEERISLKIGVSINSVEDFLNIIGLVLPEDLSTLIEKILAGESKKNVLE